MTRRSRQRQATTSDNIMEQVEADNLTRCLSHDISTDAQSSNDIQEDTLLSSSPALHNGAAANKTLQNFVLMSSLFSSNHGCVVACLGLATSQLGSSLGAAQSGILYLAYTLSGLVGSTYVVKRLGSRNALVAGMGTYIVYVGCFWLATVLREESAKVVAVYLGGAVGGVGAGFLWTAQGSYFTSAAQDYAKNSGQSSAEATSKLAGIFAFLYLALEVVLRALSTVLLQAGLDWSTVFQIYVFITALSAVLMLNVRKLDSGQAENSLSSTALDKVTAAWRLLKDDPRMKYMIGLNAVFGLSASFVNSYVNGQVVRVVMDDDKSKYIGILTAGMAAWAAIMSLVFGRLAQTIGKGPILVIGSVCFALVALPFIMYPHLDDWNRSTLVFVYLMQGTGRSTFEGTLKAAFADFFSYEKEGAFANIILQNGLSTSIGYVMTFTLTCARENNYCVPYKDGSLHDVLSFELAIVAAAVFAVAGYLRATSLDNSMAETADFNCQLSERSLLAQEDGGPN